MPMEIRPLTPDYAVSPQITPEDVAAIRAAGYVRVICNRPDAENPPGLQAEAVGAAVRAAGLEFVVNPVIGGAITDAMADAQRAAIESAPGPVLAYCASGNRSSVVWALAMAGTRPTEELLSIPAQYGYNLTPFQDWIEARARG